MGSPFAHVASRTRKARIKGLVKTKIVTKRCVQKGILKLGLPGSGHRLFDSKSINLGRSDRAQKYPVLPRSGLIDETITVLSALFSQRDIRERQFESGPSSRCRGDDPGRPQMDSFQDSKAEALKSQKHCNANLHMTTEALLFRQKGFYEMAQILWANGTEFLLSDGMSATMKRS
jgi:hypothetical protein